MPYLQTAAIILAATLLPSHHVHGHGYLNTPRSRNFVAYEDGQFWSSDPSIPAKETEPQSASPPGYTCGKIGSRDYNYPKNVVGAPLPINQQACYEVNSVIDVGVTLTGESIGIVAYCLILYCNCPASPNTNESLYHIHKNLLFIIR